MSKAKILRHRPQKMRVRLFTYLIVFVMFTLLLLWSFQFFMLDTFFYQTTKSRMTDAVDQIAQTYENDKMNFTQTVSAIGLNDDFCIFVFNEAGHAIAKVESDNGCIIHAVNGEALTSLYKKAQAHGGTYFERANLAGFQNSSSHQHPIFKAKYTLRDRILHVAIVDTAEGEITVILDAAITIANVLKGALATQLLIITFLLVIIAAIVSNILAKRLSRPIADVNRAAKMLTVGEYDVEFTGEGYREIYELSDTLNKTANDLKKTESMQKELIANISHDLRTPLTMITGYCEMMRDIEGENTPENMQVVLDETARLSSLVNDLVELSKYHNRNTVLELEEVDIDELLIQTVESYRRLMQGKDYTFVYESIGKTIVKCDKKRILQVIYNLVNNAVNYAGEDKTIILTLSRVENGKVRVEVIDHGEGIAKEDMPLIFDRYYKVDKVHKRAVTGTGLGLSIVKGILENHGATYGVKSEIGEGSIFYFEL